MMIFVEGAVDKSIIRAFLRAAGLPLNRIEIEVVSGSPRAVATRANAFSERALPHQSVAILVDLDSAYFDGAEDEIRKRFKIEKSVSVYLAVPEIEAWLFSDIEAARKKVTKNGKGSERLDSLPMPEDIPYPRHLARNLFALNEKTDLIENDINLSLAMSRTPSLKKFLLGVASQLNARIDVDIDRDYARNAGRDIFSLLMTDVVPRKTIVYKSLDGQEVSAEEMERHVKEGSETGLQYATELLRVARDLVARKARAKK